ncbi:hypothetical protein FHS95_000534 [Sphingomonas naasensis]|uniref:Uncharacterized protein n=1 Tax=Sphingomonas naasensis TaxID=1344951 RepID=A0A4S1WUP4_9SPHN|nr:hypothetical protein [Sphingomonas naasensis]NIJ18865.1 hypothetical protein [Sphingomonas naasensis]TGX46087.1 hypothetical protein E5A74_02665 [Sphingomonas naasensis]
MAVSYKSEMSLLDFEERELLRSTHHPYISELDRGTLEDRRGLLRDLRDKEKGFARQKQRESSGKAEPRGKRFPGTIARPYQRKQAFASAIKRLNREIRRHEVFEAKTAHGEAARHALELRRAQQFPERPEQKTADEGLRPLPSRRTRRILPGSQIGSVSQQNKRHQARKDKRS